MSVELDQDVEDAYKGIFLESKLFKSANTVTNMGLQDIADFAYLNFVALWIMYSEPLTAPAAMAYADRTVSFGNFKQERNLATDLYVALNTMLDDSSAASKKLADHATNSSMRSRIRINQPIVKAWLENMDSNRLDSRDAASFFLKIQRMFNIQNISYKNLARMSQEWPALTERERNLVMSRLLQYFRNHAQRSELKPMLDELALTSGYELDREVKLNPKQKEETTKALAVAAAAMYGGYKLGKAIGTIKKAVR